jgi:DNA-binding transcriptional ArsR family regulator
MALKAVESLDSYRMNPTEVRPSWTLVTSHGLVLLYVAMHTEATIREISREIGLTERRVMEILRDLKDAGQISIERQGRRNMYELSPEASFMHPQLAHIPVKDFLKLLREGAA